MNVYKINFGLLLFFLFAIASANNLMAQNTARKSITYTWNDPSKMPEMAISGEFDLMIGGIDNPVDTNIIEIFKKTRIVFKDAKGKDSTVVLYKLLLNSMKNDTGAVDKIVANAKQGKNMSLHLSEYLKGIEAGDTITIMPFLGAKIKQEVVAIKIAIEKKDDKSDPVPGSAATVDFYKYPGSFVFIPSGKLESEWAAKVVSCEFLTAPKMNKHTKWAITYDYNSGDPVAVWKRSKKPFSGEGCCAPGSEIKQKKKKDKEKKGSTSVNDQIATSVQDLETKWKELETMVKGAVLKLRTDEIRAEIDSLQKNLKTTMTEAEQQQVLDKLNEIGDKINFVSAMSGVQLKLHSHAGSDKACCSEVYCGYQVKTMKPTVKRNVLISVSNFHPYRDSFSLSVSYDETFRSDMALFNTTFESIGAGGKGKAVDSIVDKTDAHSKTLGKKTRVEQGKEYLSYFRTLEKELEFYYYSKVQQVRLDPAVVENAVNYIKRKMFDSLGITEFTEAGIVKRAEEVSDLVKETGINLSDFFSTVRSASAWWGKVANYRIFDNKSVLVRNKDLMNIEMKRYTYGRLVTSNEEAKRTYQTSDGFKIDFSLGLFGNFIVDELYTTKSVSIGNDTAFFKHSNGVVDRDSIVSITAASRDSIIRDDRGKFNIGPAIFSHFYWRTGWDINFSATIGLAINQQALPRYLFGFSTLFGVDQRLVLSGGLACGPAKGLGAGLTEGDKIKLSDYASSSLPQRDVWRNGWFVAVSWNFVGIAVGK